MPATKPSSSGRRLDSWKEIAAFFGRDERTVSRWEKELGLPVHRLPGAKGRVYAYTEELSAWLRASKNGGALAEDDPDALPESKSGLRVVREGQSPAASAAIPREEATARSGGRDRNVVRILAIAILGLGAVALIPFSFHSSARSGSINAGHLGSVRQPAGPDGVVLASTPAHDPEAEQLYLKGRYYWNKRTPDDLNKALDYFMQAVVHDPNYAQAYVGLADCYNLMREYTLMPSSEAYPRALAAAKKAVELDGRSSEAHASLAFASFFGMWDVATGELEFRRAIDLNPNNATAHHWLANALLALHRWPEALAEIDRAQSLNPSSSAILADKGNILGTTGRRDEALRLLKQMEKREPTFRSPHLYLSYVYLRQRDYPKFLAERREDARLVHDDSALAVADAAEKGYAAGGSRGMFEAMLKVQKELYSEEQVPARDVALTSALLGDKNEALRYLQAAYDQRDGALLFVETDPEFNSLNDEPAYRDLLARMNLPVPSVLQD